MWKRVTKLQTRNVPVRGLTVSRYLIFLVLICTLSVLAFAQAAIPASSPLNVHFPAAPRGEVYGGFQWETFDVHSFLGLPAVVTVPRKNFVGFHTSSSFVLHRWLAVEGEISRNNQDYNSFFVTGDKLAMSSLTMLGGPRIRYQLGPLTQFAHVLFGIDHLTAKYTIPTFAASSNSTNPFALAIGGGTSFHVSRYFGVETIADYIRASTSGAALNDIRVSVGPVFYFGGAKPEPTQYTPAPPVGPPRIIKTAPPPPPCIEYVIDAKGNETCVLHGTVFLCEAPTER
jgi:opacity protein-like surface antigen